MKKERWKIVINTFQKRRRCRRAAAAGAAVIGMIVSQDNVPIQNQAGDQIVPQ